MPMMEKCEICEVPASQRCTGCFGVYYCGKAHQKAAWKKHKKVCRPFKVQSDSVIGRHLVAVRDIKCGELVLQEAPLVSGPAQDTVAVCVGCLREITEDACRPCNKCGWPVCSEVCEQTPGHLAECRFTQLRGEKVAVKNYGIKHPLYQSITILRCLYQKKFLPEVWKKLSKLESHTEERRTTKKFTNELEFIAKFLLKFYKLHDTFTEDEIMEICGIVMINGHEVPLTQPSHVAIYETTSMFEHSCRANCYKTFTNDGEILIYSGENIRKGDHLSICYTDPLWGTPNRRHHLYETKFFRCACKRCSDVTEFDTYFSAVKCQESNCTGLLLPKTFIEDSNSNQKLSDWTCDTCSHISTYNAVQDIVDHIGQTLHQMEKQSLDACKKFINDCKNYLHDNHFYMIDVKFAMMQMIGENTEGDLVKLPEEDVVLKMDICRNLISLVEKLAPAEKRLLGLLLYELHGTIAEMGRRRTESTQEPQHLQSSLLEAKTVLVQALEYLKNHPSILPEGRLYRQGMQNLHEIDLITRSVCSRRIEDCS